MVARRSASQGKVWQGEELRGMAWSRNAGTGKARRGKVSCGTKIKVIRE